MNQKAKQLEIKAKQLRRLAKRKKVVNTPKVEKALNKYYVYARACKVVEREDKNLVAVIKWALTQIKPDDLFEIHDENDNLLWGRATKINTKVYNEEKHGA